MTNFVHHTSSFKANSSSVWLSFQSRSTYNSLTQTVKDHKALLDIWEAIFNLFLWTQVPFLIVGEFVYFYLGVGQSGSRALSRLLFIRLQGQLDVARPLGLLLGVDLQGKGSEVSTMEKRKVTSITLRSGWCKRIVLKVQSRH